MSFHHRSESKRYLHQEHEYTISATSLHYKTSRFSSKNYFSTFLVRNFESQFYLFLQQLMQLLLAILKSSSIGRIDDPDESVRRFKVIPPIRSKRLLTADVPNVQVESTVVSKQIFKRFLFSIQSN
jgi:hypothetical protein